MLFLYGPEVVEGQPEQKAALSSPVPSFELPQCELGKFLFCIFCLLDPIRSPIPESLGPAPFLRSSEKENHIHCELLSNECSNVF